MIFAFIGSIQGYHHQLHPYLGPDLDNDGIADYIDNCPPSICNEIGDGRSCANRKQLDFDGDGVGDICDICPLSPSPDDANPNGKTVGDHCSCGEMEYAACWDSTTCSDLNAGVCLYDNGHILHDQPGRCSKLADADGDGFPDECDTCSDIWDPDNTSANIHIEREVGADIIGDVCEGVPLYPIEQGPPITILSGNLPAPGSGAMGIDIQTIDGFSWLGADSNVASMQENVRFRHCSCIDELGDRLEADDCAEQLCSPTEATQLDETIRWVEATISTTKDGPPIPTAGFLRQFSRYEIPIGPTEMVDPFPEWSNKDLLFWHSYHDINREDNPIQGQGIITSHGLMASVVRDDAQTYASPRDQSFPLRVALAAVKSPMFYEMPPDLGVLLGEHLSNQCLVADCFDFLSFPFKPTLPFQPFASDPLVVFVHEGVAAMLLRNGALVEVSDRLDPLLVDLLSSGDWKVISQSERTASLSQRGLDRVGALMPRVTSLGMEPIQIYDDHGVIRLRTLPKIASSPAELNLNHQLDANEMAIYSAFEDRIYIATGGGGIRLFNVGRGSLGSIPLDRTLGSTLGGLALDPRNNVLYTLEIDSIDGHSYASVFAYELRSGDSQELFSVPWTGTYERTALLVDSADTLLLMGSKNGLTESWRFVKAADGALAQIGKRVDEGALVNEPHHGSRTAVMSLNGDFFLLQIHHKGFGNGDALDEL